MNRIEELYREKDKLTRALFLMIFIPIPGIALGLIIQINKVDKEIRRLTLDLKKEALLVVISDGKDDKKES